MMTDVLPAWCSATSFQSLRQAVSESWIPKLMERLWQCTELATMVTRSELIRLPCAGLHETYGVCTQGEHKRRTTLAILSIARTINNAAVLCKVTSSLVTRVRKFIQADGGHFEQLAWVLNGESVTVHLTTHLNKRTMLLLHS
jgi:hypothetical protein